MGNSRIYIYKAIKEIFGYDKDDLFDPCPLNANFNGLNMIWANVNYVNPPYDRKGKEGFIAKAYAEYLIGKVTILLIPTNTETKIFHNMIVPNASIFLIKNRIRFKGFNTKGEYVTNKSGQNGSMFVVFDPNSKPKIQAIDIEKFEPINLKFNLN